MIREKRWDCRRGRASGGRFADAVAATAFCRSFFPWYNTGHRHDGIAMFTPDNVHYGRAQRILEMGIAVGKAGLIAISSDNYTKWTIPPSQTKKRLTRERLNAIAIDEDGKTAIAAGRKGTILVSADSGQNWHYVESNSANDIEALTFDGVVAIFVGENSSILRSDLSDVQAVRDMNVEIISNTVEVGLKRERLNAQKDGLEVLLEDLTSYHEKTVGEPEEQRQAGFRSPEYFFLQTNALRVGIIVILMFMSQHLMVLARYDFRLAEFYQARRNVVHLAMEDVVSWTSMTPEEFEQMMRTFSPEGLEYGRTPRSAVDAVVGLAKSIVQRVQ